MGFLYVDRQAFPSTNHGISSKTSALTPCFPRVFVSPHVPRLIPLFGLPADEVHLLQDLFPWSAAGGAIDREAKQKDT